MHMKDWIMNLSVCPKEAILRIRMKKLSRVITGVKSHEIAKSDGLFHHPTSIGSG